MRAASESGRGSVPQRSCLGNKTEALAILRCNSRVFSPQRSCLGNKTEAMSNDLSGYTLVMPQRSCLGNKTEALWRGLGFGCRGGLNEGASVTRPRPEPIE